MVCVRGRMLGSDDVCVRRRVLATKWINKKSMKHKIYRK